MVKESYTLQLTVAAGSSGKTPIFRAPPGAVTKITRVLVIFPPGTNGELLVKIMSGIRDIAPKSGWYSGEDVAIEDTIEQEIYPDSTIDVHYINNSSTESRSAFILVEVSYE